MSKNKKKKGNTVLHKCVECGELIMFAEHKDGRTCPKCGDYMNPFLMTETSEELYQNRMKNLCRKEHDMERSARLFKIRKDMKECAVKSIELVQEADDILKSISN